MSTSTAALLIGACLGLFLWQLLLAVSRVPPEDKLYRDNPATGFRLVWPLIRVMSFYVSPYVSSARLETLQVKLGRAGVEYSLQAQELLAAKFIAAALFGGVSSVLAVIYGSTMLLIVAGAAVLGFHYPDNWLKQKAAKRRGEILKALPFFLDVITLSVESGSNLTGALTQAVQKTCDSPLRREFSRVLRDIRSGKSRADALRAFASRVDCQAVNQVVAGLIQAEKSGATLGPTLRAQAEQLRTRRFQKAEKKAMEAPVKLLGPLFTCIFPMTFVVLGFVMLSKGILAGFVTSPLVLWAYGWPGG